MKTTAAPTATTLPETIVAELDETVYGNGLAKKALVTTIRFNDARQHAIVNQGLSPAKLPPKKSICLTGNSGTGKTLLVESLARILQRPLVRTSCAGLVRTGIVGTSLNDIMAQVVTLNGADSTGEQPLVFLDEIDKLASCRVNNGCGTYEQSIQYQLLAILEGTEDQFYQRSDSLGKDSFRPEFVTFVMAGAFPGLPESDDGRIDPRSVIQYGLIPELVRRISFVPVDPLGEEAAKILLSEFILPKWTLLFQSMGVRLCFAPGALEALLTLENHTDHIGVSGLQQLVDERLGELNFHLTAYYQQGVREIQMTAESILDNATPILKRTCEPQSGSPPLRLLDPPPAQLFPPDESSDDPIVVLIEYYMHRLRSMERLFIEALGKTSRIQSTTSCKNIADRLRRILQPLSNESWIDQANRDDLRKELEQLEAMEDPDFETTFVPFLQFLQAKRILTDNLLQMLEEKMQATGK